MAQSTRIRRDDKEGKLLPMPFLYQDKLLRANSSIMAREKEEKRIFVSPILSLYIQASLCYGQIFKAFSPGCCSPNPITLYIILEPAGLSLAQIMLKKSRLPTPSTKSIFIYTYVKQRDTLG
jgi:hypothetical protein